MYLLQMRPEQIKQAVGRKAPVIIPMGSVEFHGNHLPVGTDFFLADEIVKRFEPHVDCVVAPPFVYGCTGYAVSGPETGTVHVRLDSLKAMAMDVLLSLYEMGFRRVIVVNHHQGADGASAMAFKAAYQQIFNEVLPEKYGRGWWTENFDTCGELMMSLEVKGPALDSGLWPGHGGRGETEPVLVFYPDAVDMSALKPNDFPWNFEPGREANTVDIQRGKRNIEDIVTLWIEYLGRKA